MEDDKMRQPDQPGDAAAEAVYSDRIVVEGIDIAALETFVAMGGKRRQYDQSGRGETAAKPTATYGVRRISGDYVGDAFKVRRISDQSGSGFDLEQWAPGKQPTLRDEPEA